MTDPSADPRWATVRPLAARWNEQQRAKQKGTPINVIEAGEEWLGVVREGR
jgi:hypothetical protein